MITAPAPVTCDRSIRLADEMDLRRICEIERLSFETPWDDDKFRASLKDEFFVFDEGEVLGFLSCSCSEVAKTAVILKIAVHPDHRGRGIATRLIRAVLARLRELHMREVELHVDIVKRGAIHLYEELGFKIRKVVAGDYEDQDAFYEMKLKLDGGDGAEGRLPEDRRA